MGFVNYNADLAFNASELDWHRFRDDFDGPYLATSFVITETGSGTRAIAQADGGILVVTNAAADNDVNSLQYRDVASGQVAEHWKFEAGKPFRFATRLKVGDATQCDLLIGLHITATTPIASPPTDGIYFRKDDGDRILDLVGRKASAGVEASGTLGVAGYLTDNTYTCLEWIYDGVSDKIVAYQDRVPFASIAISGAPTTEELAISFAHQNGEAVAKVLSLDLIDAMRLR